jgi:SAM-dependent methyltransferase
MRCVQCGRSLNVASDTKVCSSCGARIRVDAVAIDFVPERSRPTSLGARVMQSRSLARAYEVAWRPLLFGVSTAFGAPSPGGEARKVIELIGEHAGPWLDVSCGPGGLLRRLAAIAGSRAVYGLDLSRPMLERARAAAPSVTLVRGDATELPFEDATFGAVTNLAALDLYPDPARVVREAARVLAPGGRWVCSTFVRRAGSSPSRFGSVSGVRKPSIDELADWATQGGLGRLGNLLFRGYAIAWADKE